MTINYQFGDVDAPEAAGGFWARTVRVIDEQANAVGSS